MKYFTWIVLVFFLFISNVMGDELEIKVAENSVHLPYWLPTTTHYGAVVIVRGGMDEQCPYWLHHFSEQLSVYGWSVVLLNCNQANSIPWIEQLPEAISVLRQNKNHRIVVLHYGEQLEETLEYFGKPQAKMVNGLVMLSAYVSQSDSDTIHGLRFPLFDIAGQFDYDLVLSQRKSREKEFKQYKYSFIEMPGAYHDYEYSQKLLLAFIHGWMAKLPEIKPELPPILFSYIEPVNSPSSVFAVVDESDWTGFIDNPEP